MPGIVPPVDFFFLAMCDLQLLLSFLDCTRVRVNEVTALGMKRRDLFQVHESRNVPRERDDLTVVRKTHLTGVLNLVDLHDREPPLNKRDLCSAVLSLRGCRLD